MTGHLMAATAHSHEQLMFAGKIDRGYYILNTGATGNQQGIFVDHAVPHFAMLLIASIALLQQFAAQPRCKIANHKFV